MSMTFEKAKAVVDSAKELQRRWGKHISAKDLNFNEVLEALIVLDEHGDNVAGAELTKAHRQTTAAKAQAARWHKLYTETKNELAHVQKALDKTVGEAS